MEEKENAEKKTNVVAAVGVGFVCLVIGLPLWWKTTNVYRVSLPYSDINSLVQSKIEYTVDVDVVSYVEAFSAPDLAALARNLNRLLESKPEDEVRSHYRLSTRETSKEERLALKSSSSISDLDRALADQSLERPNMYKVYLMPTTASVNIQKPMLGIHRNVFIKATAPEDTTELAEIIVSTIRQSVVREATVQKGYHTARGTRNMKADKEMLRSVRFHPGYDIILTLVNPRPDLLDIDWDVEAAVKAYLMPFVELMQNYTDINIKSQVLYFTKLQTKPQREKNEYFFTSRELPLMINPLEAKLGSPASTNPELNFLVYIPSPDQHPLYIIGDNGQKLASNSFMSPQWGGITIYNIAPPPENADLPVRRSVNMGKVMEVFLSQLRLLLNLHAQDAGAVDSVPPGRAATTEWEVDSWLRSRCVENLATSSATLHSLAQLLGKISNIVINDDIGNEVHQAVAAMQESLRLLSDGYLIDAYQQSKSAIQASEKAFFDPSLLELLYFPEDQKFAIYIPLFLPISFPVLASLWQSYKWYKGLSKPKQE